MAPDASHNLHSSNLHRIVFKLPTRWIQKNAMQRSIPAQYFSVHMILRVRAAHNCVLFNLSSLSIILYINAIAESYKREKRAATNLEKLRSSDRSLKCKRK